MRVTPLCTACALACLAVTTVAASANALDEFGTSDASGDVELVAKPEPAADLYDYEADQLGDGATLAGAALPLRLVPTVPGELPAIPLTPRVPTPTPWIVRLGRFALRTPLAPAVLFGYGLMPVMSVSRVAPT